MIKKTHLKYVATSNLKYVLHHGPCIMGIYDLFVDSPPGGYCTGGESKKSILSFRSSSFSFSHWVPTCLQSSIAKALNKENIPYWFWVFYVSSYIIRIRKGIIMSLVTDTLSLGFHHCGCSATVEEVCGSKSICHGSWEASHQQPKSQPSSPKKGMAKNSKMQGPLTCYINIRKLLNKVNANWD